MPIKTTISYIKGKRDLVLFMTMGGMGFLVDYAMLQLFSAYFGWHLTLCRVFSLFIAICFTYFLHRQFTFKHQDNRILYSFPRYIASCAMMQSINYGIFSTLVILSDTLKNMPIIPLAIGSGSVMIVSFLLSKKWVFDEK